MATVRISIFGAGFPDTSGNVWPEPASITQTNKRYPQGIWRFKDTATKDSLGIKFAIPQDYLANTNPVVEILWTTTATSGNAVWALDYNSGSKTATLDPSTDEENLSVTTAAPGTSQLGIISRITLTAANLAAADFFQGKLSRNGAGADTIAADLIMYDLIFEYTNV